MTDHKANRGRRIRKARESMHISRDKLAGDAHLEYDSLFRLEQGERDLQVDEALCLAECLNVSLGWLLFGKVVLDSEICCPAWAGRRSVSAMSPDTSQLERRKTGAAVRFSKMQGPSSWRKWRRRLPAAGPESVAVPRLGSEHKLVAEDNRLEAANLRVGVQEPGGVGNGLAPHANDNRPEGAIPHLDSQESSALGEVLAPESKDNCLEGAGLQIDSQSPCILVKLVVAPAAQEENCACATQEPSSPAGNRSAEPPKSETVVEAIKRRDAPKNRLKDRWEKTRLERYGCLAGAYGFMAGVYMIHPEMPDMLDDAGVAVSAVFACLLLRRLRILAERTAFNSAGPTALAP